MIQSKNWALIPSFSNKNKKYQVKFTEPYSCDCEDFRRQVIERGLKKTCKHLDYILNELALYKIGL